MKYAPVIFALFLAVLVAIGAQLRAYDMHPQGRCAYTQAELSLPAADVLFIGASRVGTGFDPVYLEGLLRDAHGRDVTAERLVLAAPRVAQYRPLVRRYLAHRGAPRLVYLQLAYNFRDIRQDTIDLPPNHLRNQAFGTVTDLIDVQWGVPLNDTGAAVSRRLHAEYVSLPAAVLSKIEYNVYSALRFVPKTVRHDMPPCEGDFLGQNASPMYHYGEVDGAVTFDPPSDAVIAERRAVADGFLPLAPTAPWRQFETAQINALIAEFEAAGSEVVLLVLPDFGQREMPVADRADIAAAFPQNALLFPPDHFDAALMDQLEVSFIDTHHADAFGAMHLTRLFADDIHDRLAP